MNPTDVLHKLSDLGITARASGEKLMLKPGSKVPAGLLVEIKEHKTELLERSVRAAAGVGSLGRAEQHGRAACPPGILTK